MVNERNFSMQNSSNNGDRKTKVLAQQPVPAPFYPQILHGLA
jgi:hypothetical protein